MKRCGNGSRRNKITGACDKNTKTDMGKPKRCPTGSRRNQITGECDKNTKTDRVAKLTVKKERNRILAKTSKNKKDKVITIERTALKPSLKFLDWIDGSKLDQEIISSILTDASKTDAGILRYLQKNPDKISWFDLSSNPNAIEILNMDKINWERLSLNPKAIHLLEKNKTKIDWEKLSLNPNAGC